MLWTLLLVILLMWALGLGFGVAGNLVHILLVVAFVVLRDRSDLSEASLRTWITTHLASYKKPAKILFEESLPRTTVGKIHKPSLRQRLTTPTPSPNTPTTPNPYAALDDRQHTYP